jgi:hypothetical protein
VTVHPIAGPSHPGGPARLPADRLLTEHRTRIPAHLEPAVNDPTTTTPAQTLRRAAARVRQLAAAAAEDSGSPHWSASRILPDQPESRMTRVVAGSGGSLIHGRGERRSPFFHAPVGDYIATMGPGVGAALADWLDAVADEAERHAAQHPSNYQEEITDGHPTIVALALLGEGVQR